MVSASCTEAVGRHYPVQLLPWVDFEEGARAATVLEPATTFKRVENPLCVAKVNSEPSVWTALDTHMGPQLNYVAGLPSFEQTGRSMRPNSKRKRPEDDEKDECPVVGDPDYVSRDKLQKVVATHEGALNCSRMPMVHSMLCSQNSVEPAFTLGERDHRDHLQQSNYGKTRRKSNRAGPFFS
jgi:hypothetical protein